MAWYKVLVRIVLAIIVGFIVGLERERRHRPAGVKTHIMVCMGAAIVSMIQIHIVEDTIKLIADNPVIATSIKSDFGRLGAQVISGIGFLGAGTIIVRKGSIKGLTTAATLWLTACVGLAIGMGYYSIAIISTIFAMIILIGLRMLQGITYKLDLVTIEVTFSNKKAGMDSVFEYFSSKNIKIKDIEFNNIDLTRDDLEGEDSSLYHATYTVLLPRDMEVAVVLQDLVGEEHILHAIEAIDTD